jgi:hypothetical protein
VHLDGEVDAQPDEQPRDRHQGERDTGQADRPEGATGPHQHHRQGQQPPARPEHQKQHEHHHTDGDRRQRRHAALQVVVDLG